MSDVTLKVNGVNYHGWQDIRIQRGIRRFSDTFEITVSDVLSEGKNRLPIREGDACRVEIDGVGVVTGYIDDVEVTYSGASHSTTIIGRSKLCSLIDSSTNGRQWIVPMKLEKIAEELCKPFDIKVVTEVNTGDKLAHQSIDCGETCQELLSRLSDYRGVHLTSNTDGNLVITRASKQRIGTALVLGENVLEAHAVDSIRNRYHRYVVLGQHPGTDFSNGSEAAQVRGEAIDIHVRKERTVFIVNNGAVTLGDAKLLAERERNVCYGESKRRTYTVNGWHHEDGLWMPNKMVRVVDSYMDTDEWLLITHVTYRLSEGGEITEVEVMPREALDLVPLPAPPPDRW